MSRNSALRSKWRSTLESRLLRLCLPSKKFRRRVIGQLSETGVGVIECDAAQVGALRAMPASVMKREGEPSLAIRSRRSDALVIATYASLRSSSIADS